MIGFLLGLFVGALALGVYAFVGMMAFVLIDTFIVETPGDFYVWLDSAPRFYPPSVAWLLWPVTVSLVFLMLAFDPGDDDPYGYL